MHRVLTLNNIAVEGLQQFPRGHYEVGAHVSDADAILVRSQDMHDMDLPANLKAVGRAGAGVNNIPIERLSQRGVAVFNAPGANANAVKELVIAGMLLAARNICSAWDYVRGLDPSADEFKARIEAGKKQFVGTELPDKVLGVVGLGAIGVKVANAAQRLGMKVIGFDPHMTVEGAWQLNSEVQKAGGLEEMLSMCDFVTFHVPLNDATRDMLDAKRLSVAKTGLVILNFARAGVVDENAVLAALGRGEVGCYVTDFPSPVLTSHPRVIALPHLGASTAEAEANCAVTVARQLREYLEHGTVANSVNFPATRLPRAGAQRLCVANSNVPNMIGQISQILGAGDVNIVHMRNESRGELAYTLLDVEIPVQVATLAELSSVNGVLGVRAIDGMAVK